MKIICSIETLCELIAKDMPKRGKAIGITLFTLDLYQDAKLSRGTMERLQQHKENLAEITLPLKEWEAYHQEFTQCKESRRLTSKSTNSAPSRSTRTKTTIRLSLAVPQN